MFDSPSPASSSCHPRTHTALNLALKKSVIGFQKRSVLFTVESVPRFEGERRPEKRNRRPTRRSFNELQAEAAAAEEISVGAAIRTGWHSPSDESH